MSVIPEARFLFDWETITEKLYTSKVYWQDKTFTNPKGRNQKEGATGPTQISMLTKQIPLDLEG